MSSEKEEILAASFWENWKFYKELCAIKSEKQFKQKACTEQIRQEWMEEQNKNKNGKTKNRAK